MRQMFPSTVLVACLLGIALCCESDRSESQDTDDDDSNSSGDADTDADTDVDADSDADSDGDADGDGDTDGVVLSYIWIANTEEGTLSKVDTTSLIEVGRYRTSPLVESDPSRTSVNLEGDAVVTNRNPDDGVSSVTKFVASEDRCVDKNSNGTIETSTGPGDVRPWGQDECMVWHTELRPDGTDDAIGARATAWDGEDFLWIGTCPAIGGQTSRDFVFKLDGTTGQILDRAETPFCAYGGAIDGEGGFWIANFSLLGGTALARIDTTTLAIETHDISGAYGICVDSQGRVWTTDSSRVSRFDPSTGVATESAQLDGLIMGRGIAVGVKDTPSEGSIWVAETDGRLIEVDEETMAHKKTVELEDGAAQTIGVAVDYEGYVWVVSRSANAAYKVDPTTYAVQSVTIGEAPYTYSDMTGMQLYNVDPIVE